MEEAGWRGLGGGGRVEEDGWRTMFYPLRSKLITFSQLIS